MKAGASAKVVVDAAGFVGLGADDVEATGGNDGFVLLLRGGGVSRDGGVPGGLCGFELLRLVVEAEHAGTRYGRDGAFRRRDRTRLLLADDVLAGDEVGVAAEEGVRAAAGHVGRR